MSSYFGNIQNAERTQLRFDKIYSSRKAMEDALAEGDGVFIGRFVLVEYDDNTTLRRYGYLEKNITNISTEEEYVLYMDSSRQNPYKLTESDENGYGVFPDDLFYAELGLYFHYFRCTNKTTPEGYALFKSIYASYSDDRLTDYELNYKHDKDAYPKMPDHGYDATIWRKTLKAGKETYQFIASLNSEIPSFYVEEDAPAMNPIAPHFSPISTNKNLYFHLPANWGLKIKKAETVNDKKLSDVDVQYNYIEYDPVKNDTEEKNEEYAGAIYYNKDGFDSVYNNIDEKTISEISLLPTGRSGKLYYNHQTNMHEEQDDIQELKFYLPEIGNAVANLWNIVYGEGEQINPTTKKRNQDMEWNSTAGLRLVTPDTESGGFTYLKENVETIAGCVNSVHDLMGMIVLDATDTPDLSAEEAEINKIYYGNFRPDKRKGYFFKDAYYDLEPFPPEMSNEELQEWLGGRNYIDLVQFEPNKYYIYTENNFIIDTNGTPTSNTPYYLLGDGVKIKLKNWNSKDDEPENPDIPVEKIDYYYKDNEHNFIKDTNNQTDETKTYYTVTATQATEPGLVLLWEASNYFIDHNFDPELIDPTELSAMKITGVGNGYFYWDEENKILVPLTKDSEYDVKIAAAGRYYYIDKFAIASGIDLSGQTSESLYFINEDKTLTSFNKIQDDPDILNKYKITFLELKDNYYYTKMNPENEPYLEGYECLHPDEKGDWHISNQLIYWTLEVQQVTNMGEGIDGNGKEPDQPEIEEELIHFYKPGLYFTKSENNDFIISNALSFDKTKDYWRITHPPTADDYQLVKITEEQYNNSFVNDISEKYYIENEGIFNLSSEPYDEETPYFICIPRLVEKDNDNGKWLIDAVKEKFYEPNKYYYFSKKRWKDLIDQGIIMKTVDDEDVVEEYIDEKGRIYYLLNIAYVMEDPSGNLSPGYVWDKNRLPPEEVVLGKRVEKFRWTELTGFARTLNTINGLILHINQTFKFNDKITRETDSVQGCLNKIKDILKAFKQMNPQETIIIDEYSNLVGADIGTIPVNSYSGAEIVEEDGLDIQDGDSIRQALLKLETRIKNLEGRINSLHN